MIIIEPCAGLGNRFIALASAYHAAKQLNQPLTVLWKQETVLGAPMEALFTLPKDVQVKSIREYGYRLDFFGQVIGNIVKKKYRSKVSRFFECDDIMNLYNAQGQEGVEKTLSDIPNAYIKATNPFWNIFDTDKVFDFITPSEQILARKAQVLQKTQGKRIVGVHIRRADHIEAIQNSPLELFATRMQEELKAHPDTYFYLATDDKQVEKEMVEQFGDRIVLFEDKSLKRDDTQGIVDAYVEMLCLGAGDLVLGSFNSTFSLMAAKLGNVPLEVVKK